MPDVNGSKSGAALLTLAGMADAKRTANEVLKVGGAKDVSTFYGFYVLQAEIVACHARAETADATDWSRIAATYEKLAARAPSPVIELNRAVAVGMAEGPQAGLAIIECIADEPALSVPSVQSIPPFVKTHDPSVD